MLGMVLYSINLFVAGIIIGRISVGFLSVKPVEKKWNTDPDVPLPHFETALSKAIQEDLDRVYLKEHREAIEIASGIVIDPGGQTHCRRCGHSVGIDQNNCIICNNKLDFNV